MRMEYAVAGQSVVRDGVAVSTRGTQVFELARRVHRWKDAPEGCQLCRSETAMAVRAGAAVCQACRTGIAERLGELDLRHRLAPATVRAGGDEGLSGLAIVFGSLSVDLGGFFERIDSRAVDRTIAEGTDVLALVDHDPAKPIGRLSAGTYRMQKTAKGLAVSIPDPPGTTVGRDVVVSVRRRDIQGQSFGFYILPDGDEWAMEGDIVVRTVHDMRFLETSIVSFPAYRATTIEVVDGGQQRDVEFLRMQHKTRMAAHG